MFIIMYLIVFIHEAGHITMAYLFNWNIKKINIYPFGGYTLFSESINKPFIEEFLVFFGGILFQIISFTLVTLIFDNTSYVNNLFYSYNLTILIFNMIPIIPLDGSKILNIILNYIFPFKKSHLITIYTSYIILLILLLIFYKDINMILICILMLFILIKEHKNHIYIFNTFLVERYLKRLEYNRNNIINPLRENKIKKYFNNIFVKKNIYYSEYEVLRNKYEK